MAQVKKKAVIDALQRMQGNVSAAARALGVARITLHRRINADPDLQAVVEDARQSMVDNAESALNRAVINGEAWAVCFTLKTQGRKRGYVERQELEHTGAGGGGIEIVARDYRAAIAPLAPGSVEDSDSPG